MRSESCDIFCNVVDNYGDIGVCWRLARQLANEHGLAVRLWVDDLGSLARLCPEADVARDSQQCRGVEVRYWIKPFPEVQPAGLVIEAFACKLPQSYIEAMAAQQRSVWINLEYLSAENWVEGCHKLPSPHPGLPLTRYFFFPGFTRQTGGLLLERDLLARRDAFQGNGHGKDTAPDDETAMPVFLSPSSPPLAGERDIVSLREFHVSAAQQAFWQSLGMETPSAEALKISLFGYENDALAGLFDVWASGAQPVLCLVPEGRILPQVGQYFGAAAPRAGGSYARGNLQVRVLPFTEQERYDELLWACDVNFVRGEDSCVRAQWAAKPFVWQIYPQHDAVHWDKLQAFLDLYNVSLGVAAGQAMQELWRAWNSGGGAGQAWSVFIEMRGELELHAQQWARQLAANNLALNLLDFSQKIGRMRALKIEGQ